MSQQVREHSWAYPEINLTRGVGMTQNMAAEVGRVHSGRLGVLDDDVPNRRLDGLIGMQVHVGPPMKIEYRNIRLKRW
jgi:hypothetical protein